MTVHTRSRVAIGLLALAASVPAAPAAGLQTAAYSAAVLDTDPASGVVATAIRFASGSADDPRGGEGTATLLGRVLESQLGAAVRAVGAGVQVDTQPNSSVVTMVAAGDRWQEATRLLLAALFDAPLEAAEVELARDDLQRILVFESGAPVREFEVELARFLYGELDDHARPSLGTFESVSGVSPEGLEAYRSEHLVPSNAAVAVSGPAERIAAERLFGTTFTTLVGPRPATTGTAGANAPAPPRLELYRTGSTGLEVPGAASTRHAWDSEARVVVDRDITSTRISVATPIPVGTPPILADFLSHLILEDLTPSPPDPGLYDATVEVMLLRGDPVIVVTAAVDPRVTERWGDRVFTAIGRMASQPPEGAFFELARRRFRTDLVMELAVPEDRARWLARQAATGREVRSSPEQDVWGISREAVSSLASAAGPARMLVFGPSTFMPQD